MTFVICLDVYCRLGFNFIVSVLAAVNHRINSLIKSCFVKFCFPPLQPCTAQPQTLRSMAPSPLRAAAMLTAWCAGLATVVIVS